MTYSLHHIGIVLFYVCRRAEAHASVVLELLDALPKHVFVYVGRMSHAPLRNRVMGVRTWKYVQRMSA